MNIKNKFILILIFQCFFSSFAVAKSHKKVDVAICAIFQNEAPFLKEWIEFHKVVGVKRFYLFNNFSDDDYQAILEPYIKSGLVKLIDWPYRPDERHDWNFVQCAAYNHAIKIAKKKASWLAFLDTDEFLFPVEAPTLSKFLKDYKHVSGVVVNWQMYGTSFVESVAPEHLLIENLILKAPIDYHENVHVKSIVRPKHVKHIDNPHYVHFKKGRYAVNSNDQIVRGPHSSPVLIDKIRINHYWTRDVDYFTRVKVPRRQSWCDGAIFERASNLNAESDPVILKYVPALKKSL